MKTTFISGAMIAPDYGVIFVTRMSDGTWCTKIGAEWRRVVADYVPIRFTTQRRAFAAIKRYGGRRLSSGIFQVPQRTLDVLYEDSLSEAEYIRFRTTREGQDHQS